MQDQLYNLILSQLNRSHNSPEKVTVFAVKSRIGRSLTEGQLMDLVCELVDRRIQVEEAHRTRNMLIFRHVGLTDNGAHDMNLEVIFNKEAIEHVTPRTNKKATL